MRKLVFGLAVLLLGATVGAQDKLVLVSPHWEGIQREFEWAFQSYYRKRTGRTVTLQWLDVGGTMAILRYIRTNFSKSPEGIGVDIFWGGGIDPYLQLKREGLLQPVKAFAKHNSQTPKDRCWRPPLRPRWHVVWGSRFGFRDHVQQSGSEDLEGQATENLGRLD